MFRETPADYVHAWYYFRTEYLSHPQAFFYKRWLPSPPFHFELVSFMRKYERNAIAAPRGHAKSTVIGEEIPLLECVAPSIPGMSLTMLLMKDDFVEERFERLQMQLEENPRIREDFGRLRRSRGNGLWNHHYMRLANNVTVSGISVQGGKRGKRPDIVIIDDPEVDFKTGTDSVLVTDDMNEMLKRQVLGMLDPGTCLYWIGTLVSRRHFLYHIIKGDDPTFDDWNKKIYQFETPNKDTGEVDILWSKKWSKENIEKRKREMGVGAWNTEYNNDPRSDEDVTLPYDPIVNGYDMVRMPDDPLWLPQMSADPLSSDLEVRWRQFTRDKTGTVSSEARTSKFGDHAKELRRYMLVDYAPTTTSTSDYSAAAVVGLDTHNTLWVLDAWQGKLPTQRLLRQIWNMALKWRPRAVGVEAVTLQDEFRRMVAEYVVLNSREGEWRPHVIPIRYPNGVSKSERIQRLEWRFARGLIKFPDYLKKNYRDIKELLFQVENFTPKLDRLKHDDLIDALSMINYLLPVSPPQQVPLGKPTTIEERILSGDQYLDDGGLIPLIGALPVSEWTPELVDAMGRTRNPHTLGESPTFLHQLNEHAPYLDLSELEFV